MSAPFFPAAFGALAAFAEHLEAGGHLEDWSQARPLMEGTFAEEREPHLTVLERQAQNDFGAARLLGRLDYVLSELQACPSWPAVLAELGEGQRAKLDDGLARLRAWPNDGGRP